MNISAKHTISLIASTAITVVLWFATLMWTVLTQIRPPFFYVFVGVLVSVLIMLIIVDFVAALFLSKQRMLGVAIMSIVTVVIFSGSESVGKWAANKERRWFFQDGIKLYGPLISNISKNKMSLTSENLKLEYITGRSDIYGRTNPDGSMIVMIDRPYFLMRHHGYVYYSGSQMNVTDLGTNIFTFPNSYKHLFLRLTNDWYESLR